MKYKRDPKRIKRICKLLEDNWKKVPDQRLGQFLANYVFGHHKDIFYQEDDVIENIKWHILTPERRAECHG